MTSKVDFLGMREVTERPFVSHFLVVTDRRVLVFWIAYCPPDRLGLFRDCGSKLLVEPP